eukprot:995630-Amorphochlora_amoeboformis.AAC.2
MSIAKKAKVDLNNELLAASQHGNLSIAILKKPALTNLVPAVYNVNVTPHWHVQSIPAGD